MACSISFRLVSKFLRYWIIIFRVTFLTGRRPKRLENYQEGDRGASMILRARLGFWRFTKCSKALEMRFHKCAHPNITSKTGKVSLLFHSSFKINENQDFHIW